MENEARKSEQRMTALDDLITAVEAGKDFGLTGLAYGALGERREADLLSAAFDGSLDAAKSLHEALLPGWMWVITPAKRNALVYEDREIGVGYVFADNHIPARAWLLATLRAYRATLDAA